VHKRTARRTRLRAKRAKVIERIGAVEERGRRGQGLSRGRGSRDALLSLSAKLKLIIEHLNE